MKKAPAMGQALGRTGMNNVNINFNFKYPSKKERFSYAVKSILIDELTILAESIAIAAILCSFFSNEWSIPQKYNVFIVLLYVVFFVSQILILLRAALTGRYTLKEIIIRRVEK